MSRGLAQAALVGAVGVLPAMSPAAGQTAHVVLTDVAVVAVGDRAVLPNRTVVIAGEVIIAIGPRDAISIPDGATVIDGRGRYLAPGLIDFHVRLRSPSELVSYVRHGVTSVVQLSGGLSGAPDVLAYRRALAEGRLVGPTLYASGPILDGAPPINPGVSVAVTTPEEGRAEVRRQVAQGYDLIKVYNRLPAEILPAVVDEAHRLGVPVAGHIPRPGDRATALQAALGSGMDVIAHGEEFFFTYFYGGIDSLLDLGAVPWRDDRDIAKVTRWVRDAAIAIIPNLSFVAATRTQLDSIDVLWKDPEFAHLEVDVQAFWRNRNFGRRADVERFDRRERAKAEFLDRLALAFSRAGVPLLLGTDASYVGLFPGTSAHLELRQLVEAGLSPDEAVATGTVTPGRFLVEHGMSPVPVGEIAVGARADLLLLRGNPLVDVAAVGDIIGVVARGRWYTVAELEALRRK